MCGGGSPAGWEGWAAAGGLKEGPQLEAQVFGVREVGGVMGGRGYPAGIPVGRDWVIGLGMRRRDRLLRLTLLPPCCPLPPRRPSCRCARATTTSLTRCAAPSTPP